MTLDQIRAGGKRALALALVEVETRPDAPETAALLDEAWAAPTGTVLGLTGPPGVGKSTLTDALIRAWRSRGKTIAVIAVDPSSTRTGGALLGDRTRLTNDPTDQGVFVRSMAARDQLGGVAEITFSAAVLLRALYDLVIVETVGVGQSETEIAGIADITAFLAQPGSGDSLQYMKAGIMEVPDLVVVTKADLGAIARRTVSDLRGALSLTPGRDVSVVPCAAATGQGVNEVLHEICTLITTLEPRFGETRESQVKEWAKQRIQRRFGTEGVRLLIESPVNPVDNLSFSAIQSAHERLAKALSAAFE